MGEVLKLNVEDVNRSMLIIQNEANIIAEAAKALEASTEAVLGKTNLKFVNTTVKIVKDTISKNVEALAIIDKVIEVVKAYDKDMQEFEDDAAIRED